VFFSFVCKLKNMTDKTVIIVKHRPAALEICDRVIDFTNTDGSEGHFRSFASKAKGSAFLQSLFVIIRPRPNTLTVRV